MPYPIHSNSRSSLAVLRHLIQDFLEMTCYLSPSKLHHLIQELFHQGIRGEEIHPHPSFSVQRQLVTICTDNQVEEWWIYVPKLQTFRKIKI